MLSAHTKQTRQIVTACAAHSFLSSVLNIKVDWKNYICCCYYDSYICNTYALKEGIDKTFLLKWRILIC